MKHSLLFLLLAVVIPCLADQAPPAADQPERIAGSGESTSTGSTDPWTDGAFAWKSTGPCLDVGPGADADDPHIALKDPTVVFDKGQWHVLTTLRQKSGRVVMEQLSFADWNKAKEARRATIDLHPAYHCAPQLFFFTPHQKWYLIYQAGNFRCNKGLTPVFSTTGNLNDPSSWTKPEPLLENAAPNPKGIDFWVICDEASARLFYTSDDGHFWRRDAKKADFPHGWGPEVLVMQDAKDELFEASHTYALKGRGKFLTILEAMAPGRRYYKAFLADRLDGPWQPLAATKEKPFAARENVSGDSAWCDSVSHGELIRCGIDETLTVDPNNLRFLIQGVDAAGYRAGKYGGIPWKLGVLEQTPAPEKRLP